MPKFKSINYDHPFKINWDAPFPVSLNWIEKDSFDNKNFEDITEKEIVVLGEKLDLDNLFNPAYMAMVYIKGRYFKITIDYAGSFRSVESKDARGDKTLWYTARAHDASVNYHLMRMRSDPDFIVQYVRENRDVVIRELEQGNGLWHRYRLKNKHRNQFDDCFKNIVINSFIVTHLLLFFPDIFSNIGLTIIVYWLSFGILTNFIGAIIALRK